MRKALNISVISAFFALCLFSLGYSEQITITTYYPSPFGSYNELRTNMMSVGTTYAAQPLVDGYLIVQSRVGIGVLSPTVALDVVGDALITGNLTVTGLINGAPFPSDQRLKDIIGTCEYGIDVINQLNTVRFRFKKDNPLGLSSDKEYIGLIAQEVQKVIPEAVDMGANGYLSLETSPILYSMLNAIKEQQAEIEFLKKEVIELKNKGKKR